MRGWYSGCDEARRAMDYSARRRLAALFVAFRLANGGAWESVVMSRNASAYPAVGIVWSPWAKQVGYTIAFLGLGAITSVLVQRRQWRQVLEPWLVGAIVLLTFVAVAVVASPALRVIYTGRDTGGKPVCVRVTPMQGPLCAAEAIALGAIVLRLRRSRRS